MRSGHSSSVKKRVRADAPTQRPYGTPGRSSRLSATAVLLVIPVSLALGHAVSSAGLAGAWWAAVAAGFLGARALRSKAGSRPGFLGEEVARDPAGGHLRGWKQAVVTLRDGQVALLPLTSATPYGPDEDAQCRRRYMHGASVVDSCSCGFYAFKDAAEARAHTQGTEDSVLLKVAVSGVVVEHEDGYRFGHQRVVAVHLEWCSGCQGAPAVSLGASRHWTDALSPLCPTCADERGGSLLGFDELEASLRDQVGPGRRLEVVSLLPR